MRQLEIVFTKSKKKLAIGSYIIRLWTFKSYSHVAMRFSSRIFNNETYYQASNGMVNYMSDVQFEKQHEIVKSYTLQIDNKLYSKIRNECHEEAGAPYGFMQNLGIVIADLLKLTGITIKNPFKSGRNCSELLYVHVLKYLTDLEVDPDLVKPHHIERIVKSINNN